MKTPHRSAKFTSEPTSSRISIRGGRPASMARSLRSRCANEWSVPIAALSMSSMARAGAICDRRIIVTPSRFEL